MRHFRIERDGDGIAWVTFDKAGASVNTLSADVFAELSTLVGELLAQPPRAMVLRSGKPSGFIAGADINEFHQIKSSADAIAMVRRGWDGFNALAALPFTTVAWIDGYCIGGGLECALACKYRVVVDQPGTRLSLPEVMLGIVPDWGGVKRLPALVGPQPALDMLLTGKSVDARRAQRMGLADICVPPRVTYNAVRATALNPPRRRKPALVQRLMQWQPARRFVADMARKQVAARARREHYPAPYSIIAHWERCDGDAFRMPESDPLSVTSLIEHPTARNLIRVFGLQERLKSLGKASDFQARHVHVVGAGVMGGDIAAWCALRGLTVTLEDVAIDRLKPAFTRAGELFAKRLRDPRRVRDAHDRLLPDVAGDGVRRADVVIEAIFENLAVKRELFARLEAQAKPAAVLATNTSSLKLGDIAAALGDPSRLVGIHFFNPVAQLQLVEVVKGEHTGARWSDAATAFVRAIDKLPLPVKDVPGFLVNRVLGPYLAMAFRMIDEGIAAESIDAAAEKFGMPMGPIELADVVGLDICVATGKSLTGAESPPACLAQRVEAKQFGKKSGQGFYRWERGKALKQAAGAVSEEMIERLITPYLNTARAAVEEGVVADADLADAGLIFATGFAPFRGGPLHYTASRA